MLRFVLGIADATHRSVPPEGYEPRPTCPGHFDSQPESDHQKRLDLRQAYARTHRLPDKRSRADHRPSRGVGVNQENP